MKLIIDKNHYKSVPVGRSISKKKRHRKKMRFVFHSLPVLLAGDLIIMSPAQHAELIRSR